MHSTTLASITRSPSARLCWAAAVLAIAVSLPLSPALAQPDYQQTVLHYVYPAGGQQGTTVKLQCYPAGGATSLLIDPPQGIEVLEVDGTSGSYLKATIKIAPDAEPGARMLRLRGGVTGLTNLRWFFVGELPERVEKEPNSKVQQAEAVQLPLVINGQVRETLDLDCFKFQATAGQELVAALKSHRLDAMSHGRGAGYFDANLELLDAQGRVLAESGDVLGYDPLLHFSVPADGEYIVRVSGLGYKGFLQAVYRLTLGEVPYPTTAFPAGGRRGESVQVELTGPNVPAGTSESVLIDAAARFPLQKISLQQHPATNHVPLVRGAFPEVIADGKNATRESALKVELPSTVNARFLDAAGEHWYRVDLAEKQKLTTEITAQRLIDSPIDTLLEVYGPDGKLLAANDDGEIFASECVHDFVPFDSRLETAAKQQGEHLIRIAEQTGTRGAGAIYRLALHETEPDFRLYLFPDAVPIWGPGTTAAVCVEVTRLGDLRENIELSVEGLPEGWEGSVCQSNFHEYKVPRNSFGAKSFLTITAPEDAEVGSLAEFRIVGRATVGDRTIERVAQPLSLYMWQQPNHFRASPIARAAVAPKNHPWLSSASREVEVQPGDQIEIPVTIHYGEGQQDEALSLAINRASTHFKCAIGPPIKVAPGATEVKVPLAVNQGWKPGHTYSIVVALAWASETRKGLPGPCTRLIHLKVPSE